MNPILLVSFFLSLALDIVAAHGSAPRAASRELPSVISSAAKCNVTTFDECGYMVTTFHVKGKIPETQSEVQELCDMHYRGYKCIIAYSNDCLNTLLRQVMIISMKAFRQTVADMCTTDAIQAFVNVHHKCINDTIDQLVQCSKRILLKLEAITTSAKDDQLTMSCCAFSEFADCSLKIVEDNCDRSSVDFIQTMIGSSSSDMLELVCEERDFRSDTCRKAAAAFDEDIFSRKQTHKSVFPSLLKIIQSLS